MHFLALVVMAAAPNAQLWVEHGSNLESLANERFVLRWDRTLLVERGKPVVKKNVTTGTCERFTWKLTDAQVEALSAAVAAAEVTKLSGAYVEKGVHDGSQGGLVAMVGQTPVVATFSNSFPPAYQAVMKALRELEATLPKPKKAGKCDVATWFFIRPPNE